MRDFLTKKLPEALNPLNVMGKETHRRGQFTNPKEQFYSAKEKAQQVNHALISDRERYRAKYLGKEQTHSTAPGSNHEERELGVQMMHPVIRQPFKSGGLGDVLMQNEHKHNVQGNNHAPVFDFHGVTVLKDAPHKPFMGDVISGQEEQEARRKYAQDFGVDPRDATHKHQPPPASVIFNNATGKVEKYDKKGRLIYDNTDMHITNDVDISGFNIDPMKKLIEDVKDMENTRNNIARKGFGPGGGGWGPGGPGHRPSSRGGPGSQYTSFGDRTFYTGSEGSRSSRSYIGLEDIKQESVNGDFEQLGRNGFAVLQSLFNVTSRISGSLLEAVQQLGPQGPGDDDGAKNAAAFIESEGNVPLTEAGKKIIKKVTFDVIDEAEEQQNAAEESGEAEEPAPPGFFGGLRNYMDEWISSSADFIQYTKDHEAWKVKHDPYVPKSVTEDTLAIKQEMNTKGAETITKNTNAGPSAPTETGHHRSVQNLPVEPAFQEQNVYYAQTGTGYRGNHSSTATAAELHALEQAEQRDRAVTARPFGTPIQFGTSSVHKSTEILQGIRYKDAANEQMGASRQQQQHMRANRRVKEQLQPSRPPRSSHEGGRLEVVHLTDQADYPDTTSIITTASLEKRLRKTERQLKSLDLPPAEVKRRVEAAKHTEKVKQIRAGRKIAVQAM